MTRNASTKTHRELLADELGTLHREAAHRVALVYPSPYRTAMSSLGYQTIYRLVNGLEGFAADRAMLPDEVPRPVVPGSLSTLERGAPVGGYPIIAFSVAYELEIAGVIDCLAQSGLAPLADDRPDDAPLVVAGGPLTFSNPVPMAPFFDLILMGEGEDLVIELCRIARELDFDRRAVVEHFRNRPGFYVPSADGDRCPAIARADDHHVPARSQILTPNTELRSMFLTEAARGCSRGCTYCVMRRSTNGGMRHAAPDAVLAGIPAAARRVGLVGAAVTDHPQIVEIVRRVVEPGREIGISSLRADKLTDELVALLAQGGYRTLTVALDAASARLRDAIERKTNEAHLVRTAELARKHGLKTVKAYMILGLPGETEADIDELVRFALELRKIHPRIALGVAPFVAKRNTPMDGEPFAGIATVDSHLKRLRKGLRGQVEVRPTSARWAWVEHMLSQGDRRAGLAVLQAHTRGGRFADYKRAFEDLGCEPIGPLARVPSSREIAAQKRESVRKRLVLHPEA